MNERRNAIFGVPLLLVDDIRYAEQFKRALDGSCGAPAVDCSPALDPSEMKHDCVLYLEGTDLERLGASIDGPEEIAGLDERIVSGYGKEKNRLRAPSYSQCLQLQPQSAASRSLPEMRRIC